jgi:hypothetical protein
VSAASLRAWWDAHVHASDVWERLREEAENEIVHADLELADYFTAAELYGIAGEVAAFAELLELRADLLTGEAA